MKQKPLVSLIIACYNQVEYLDLVLTSLHLQTFRDFEVVIADDGSDAKLAELLVKHTSSFTYPIQHIWHEDKGFRKTIIANKAIMASKSDYLVFIDGDCILESRFIERHFKRKKVGQIQAGRRVKLNQEISQKIGKEDIVSGRLFQKNFWYMHVEDKKSKHRGDYRSFYYPFINLQKNEYWLMGCNFSIYKKDLIEVNGYDERIIGRGLEDCNLSKRLIIKGKKIKRITYEALQYHLFHYADAVPHSEEATRSFHSPDHFWAEQGIVKST